MPLPPDSQFETVSLVVAKEQARRIRALAAARSTVNRPVKISEVAREVIAAGLEQITRGGHSIPVPSIVGTEAA